MKGNPKKSILDINAVKTVYVESCYKIFMSIYKKSNDNDDISHVSDLPFDEMCLFLECKVDDTALGELTINMLLEII